MVCTGYFAVADEYQTLNDLNKTLNKHNVFPGNASATAFGDLLESGHSLRELNLGWNQVRVYRIHRLFVCM